MPYVSLVLMLFLVYGFGSFVFSDYHGWLRVSVPWQAVSAPYPSTPCPCKLPLVGRTLISCCLIRETSHFICSHPSTCLSLELALFHYYSVNLLHVIFHFFIGDRSSQEWCLCWIEEHQFSSLKQRAGSDSALLMPSSL